MALDIFRIIFHERVNVLALVLTSCIEDERLFDLELFAESSRIGNYIRIHSYTHDNSFGTALREAIKSLSEFCFGTCIEYHTGCFREQFLEFSDICIGFIVEAGDEHRLVRAHLSAVIRSSEHIWYEYEQRIIVNVFAHISVKVGAVYHFTKKSFFFFGGYRRFSHKLCINCIESGVIAFSYLESADGYTVSGRILAFFIIVHAPVRAEFLNTGSKYLNRNTSVVQM